MYYDYFGLSEAPFSIAPNPEYLFLTGRHQEALAHLYHSLESDAGFVLLTGDVGTGKTTVCRSFIDNLSDDTEVAFILNPFLSGRELLMMICQELNIGEQPENVSLRQLTNAIYNHLLNNHAIGKQTVLLIDEAQHLHFKVLELIRLLTNLETDRQKLLKIVLVGQPELNETLEKPELTQLSQRITARYHIRPLSFEETIAYIDYRLRMAGYMSEKKIFPKAIVRKIYSITGGVPRLINVICDRALLGTYSSSRAVVDPAILNKAIVEVKGEKQLKRNHRRLWFAGGAAALSVLLLVSTGFYFFGQSQGDTKTVELLEEPSTSLVDRTEPAAPEAISPTLPVVSGLEKGVVVEGQALNPPAVQPLASAKPVSGKESIAYYVTSQSATKALIQSVRKDSSLLAANCESLKSVGWQCRKSSAENWLTLQQYNRPAVITLNNIVGESYYLPVLAMNVTYADVLTPKGIKRLRLSDLADEWSGEFVYLWQPPQKFVDYIFFDSDASLVNWLANAFAVIDERDEVLAQDQFNVLLKKRIVLFQRENNLVEDGIAGIETLLKLNEKLGVAVTLAPLVE